MISPSEALSLIGTYGSRVNAPIREILHNRSYDMYGMMSYFLGFKNEKLETKEHFVGKRIRPGLMLFLAQEYGVSETTLPAAISIELFHNFTLIHDDVMDQDEERRGRPTVWKLWGKDHAINTGDGQMILAMQALASLPSNISGQKAKDFLLRAYLEVVEGQYLDFQLAEYTLADERVSEEMYQTMIQKKTAALIDASTVIPGLLASCPPSTQNALSAFGTNLGLAYQIHDDLESLWGDEGVTGKKQGGDIRERKKTLPILRAREMLVGNDRAHFIERYDSKSQEMRDEEEIISLIEKTDAREYAKSKRDVHRARALEALPALEISSSGKETLKMLVEAFLPV